MSFSMNTTPTRQAILHLYKQCLKSAKRIPNPEQRLMYIQYVQDGFHRKKDLVAASPQAIAAIYDAKDQLDRMNYYHSIREIKKKEEMKKKQSHRHDGKQQQHVTRQGDEWNEEKHGGGKETVMVSKEKKEKIASQMKTTKTPTIDHSKPSTTSSLSSTPSSEREKYDIVSNWLAFALPHLHSDDHTSYVQNFVQDGFDSIAMLEDELLEEDLMFMKKAHRRSLWRYIAAKKNDN